MIPVLRWLIPDRALTWEHKCIASRFDPYNGCAYHLMYAGGLDIGYIRTIPRAKGASREPVD